MDEQIELDKLAEHAGGWENLAKKLWKHTPKPERARAIRRIVPQSEPTEAEKLSASFQRSSLKSSRRGPKVKYDPFGLIAVYLALDYMKLHNIGNTDKTGRTKLLVAYVNDPKNNRITGLQPSLRQMLTEDYEYSIVPRSETPDAIAAYVKHLDAKKLAYDGLSRLAVTLSDELSAYAKYDYEGD